MGLGRPIKVEREARNLAFVQPPFRFQWPTYPTRSEAWHFFHGS